MGMLEMLLGNAGLERTITIKTKPTKEQAPEAPIDPASANLPSAVMQMMGGQQQMPQGSGNIQGQVPNEWVDPRQQQAQIDAQQQAYAQLRQQMPNFYGQ